MALLRKSNLSHIESLFISTLVKGELGAVAPAYLIDQWFDILCSQYAQPYRKYHVLWDPTGRALGHIEFMLAELQRVKHLVKHFSIMVMGILFHDFIYRFNTKTNERDSSRCLETLLLQMGAPRITIGRGHRLIMATRHIEGQKLRTNDERIIADLDLMGFGLSYDAALANSLKVREEYSHVSDEDFARGHGQVIMGFMRRGINLYHTPHFKELYNEQAHKNLRRILFDMREISRHKGKP